MNKEYRITIEKIKEAVSYTGYTLISLEYIGYRGLNNEKKCACPLTTLYLFKSGISFDEIYENINSSVLFGSVTLVKKIKNFFHLSGDYVDGFIGGVDGEECTGNENELFLEGFEDGKAVNLYFNSQFHFRQV